MHDVVTCQQDQAQQPAVVVGSEVIEGETLQAIDVGDIGIGVAG
ncbi:Uncharacterised protein [Mycobacterium tuberculosis]|uniref:Uncharacterized protein n=1 Tax=Mycobacterium tuberculosis TaxID=1773 RepID=A0A0T9XW39_MYCTX|nr:Uncharacterised protein [Mycobacterium tuberculosis]CFE83768.1 Uncharacterised protein [Mycobacterium tuberculosis]CFR88856.1 Uncharacterised protein [Mycobacterium tuberculosis]CFS11046.1 Uncharacterised protein [Mycobacterium tuberculosis]CFS18047.1 Uncharacterised protein [Mycobacterium tuberculosis]